MILTRLDRNPNPSPDKFPDDHSQESYDIEPTDEDDDSETATLRVRFNRFGRGDQRRSAFAVEISWLDVKSLVYHFIDLGHPEAVHLQKMMKLVKAIDAAGWSPRNEAPDEFWDILPDSD